MIPKYLPTYFILTEQTDNMKISEISIHRPVYVTVLFLVITILGLLGFRSLQSELMPKFTPPTLNVTAVYPGASPTEVESSLTRKLEDALSSLQGVESIRSFSFEGMSMVFVSFRYGTDIDKAMTDAGNRISARKALMPASVLAPSINKITVDDRAAITLALRSGLESGDFCDLVEQRIVPELLRLRGVAKVDIIGEQPREIQVNLDLDALNALGISPLQITGAIRAANLDIPAGSLKNARTRTSIRLAGKISSVEQLRSLVLVTLPSGAQIRLGDVAQVAELPKEVSKLARVDGEEAVLLNVFKQADANAISLSDDISVLSSELQRAYAGAGLGITVVSDTSDFTRESVRSVFTDLLLAILLVTLVILLFLNNVRNALIVMAVVPISLIGTFIGMQLFGFTLNLMSLLGMSVVIGVLVDDAIVVIENVYRHQEMGKTPVRATLDAMREIGGTVVSVTIVLVIVFLPIALTESLVSDILRQFCGVIVFSILLSLLAALTLVPLLMSRFSALGTAATSGLWGKMTERFERGVRHFADSVAALLSWSLDHKKTVFAAVIALTVAVCALFPLGYIGFEFMPDVDRSEFSVLLEMPKDISIEESSAFVAGAEDWLLRQPEVTGVVSMVGITNSEGESTRGSAYLAEMGVKTVPPSQRAESVNAYAARVRRELTEYLVDARVRTFPSSLHGSANSSALEYVICGSDADSVASFGEYALEVLRGIPGTVQQQLSSSGGMPEFEIIVDRDKMSSLGLSAESVAQTLQLVFQGNSTLKFVRGEYEYDIDIRADAAFRDDVDDLSALVFLNSRGERIALDQFALISVGTGPARLERYDRNPSVTLSSNVAGISPGQVSRQFLSSVRERAERTGVTVTAVGNMKSMGESMGVLTAALLLSLVLIYLALTVLYNNWADPFAVMFSIPFSILGAILALALSGTSLNIYAMLGIVMLVGLVAKNAILLVDFASVRLAEGGELRQALLDAVRLRTRPILMTALSTVIGMIPVALASGSSAELRNGIGWVIIGGMLLSTLLTLIVVPTVYSLLHRKAGK